MPSPWVEKWTEPLPVQEESKKTEKRQKLVRTNQGTRRE
jgi:hypothetical protein